MFRSFDLPKPLLPLAIFTALALLCLAPMALAAPTFITPSQIDGCQYQASPGTLVDGQMVGVQCDASGRLQTTAATTGNTGAGATDSGNPVKIGCIFQTVPATVTDGQRSNVQCGQRGNINTTIWNSAGNAAAQTSGALADGTANALGSLNVTGQNMLFNGTTWDRQFYCNQQAQVTVTAGATTQIVALSGSTVIRVCSIHIGISATGTYSFVQGTGSNCATGTATIIPATSLITGNVVTANDQGGLFQSGSGNALCIAAVTGNVQAFVRYAQY